MIVTFLHFYIVKKKDGVAMIIATILVLFALLTITASFLFLALNTSRLIQNSDYSFKTYYVAEGGAEDLLLRSRSVLYDMPMGTSTLVVGDGIATSWYATLPGGTQVFTSDGVVSSRSRRVTVTTASTNEVEFSYGVQVGDLGIRMDNNAQIQGSVWSNGPIVGPGVMQCPANDCITNNVFMATSSVGVDANWITQNDDFSFGRQAGGPITIVDSTGDVGEYNSLALGSDGFARISYYDNTGDDLEFARCTNADCTARNLNTVDSTGDVGWRYTSIALDVNGFPRISYYDNTGDDLEYARCTNVDCSARNLRTLDSSGDIGQFSALTLDTSNFARISYYTISGGNLKYIRCLDDDCSSLNPNVIDATGDVGKYTSIALGTDGFARISYHDETNNYLKFVRCTNADCTTMSTPQQVDTSADVGKYVSSVVLGADGFARISYYDDDARDLKFIRCTDADCTTRNTAIVDSGGDVGKYSSLELGPDGFGRISYYDASNGSVKFARCLDQNCLGKVATTVDSAGDTGHYTSLAIGPDGFGRISYHDETLGDLKFVRCVDANCLPYASRADVAQSFRVTNASPIRKVSLYIRKVGNPPNIPIRVVKDKNGEPSDAGGDLIASGTLAGSSVGASYAWVDVNLSPNPSMNISTIYWIVADGSIDAANYWVWGIDNTDAYTQGTGVYSSDWTAGTFSNMNGDFNFRVWLDLNNRVEDIAVGGNVDAPSLIDCDIGGNARYNTKTNCTITGSETSPTTPLDPLAFPISDAQIESWKDEAEAGGVISGNYTPPADTTTELGPVKITGNLNMTNNQTLVLTGTVWVVGTIDVDNGSTIELHPNYGSFSGVILSDGWIHIKNNTQFRGSGDAGSYLMVLTTNNCVGTPIGGCTHHDAAVDLHNNATGAIFYAGNGLIYVHNNVTVSELVARKIELKENAVLIYEQGLADALFSGGPSGGSTFLWQETY